VDGVEIESEVHLPAPPDPGPITNSTVVELFCYVMSATNLVDSARPILDYTPVTSTLAFDDHQMNAFFDVRVEPTQGPDFPVAIVNRYVQLNLLGVRLDPLES
jgi:hypothetical protein